MTQKPDRFALNGREDEANILNELIRMRKTHLNDSKRHLAEAAQLADMHNGFLAFFRKNLNKKKKGKKS